MQIKFSFTQMFTFNGFLFIYLPNIDIPLKFEQRDSGPFGAFAAARYKRDAISYLAQLMLERPVTLKWLLSGQARGGNFERLSSTSLHTISIWHRETCSLASFAMLKTSTDSDKDLSLCETTFN